MTIVEPSVDFYENARQLSHDQLNINCINGFFEDVVEKGIISKGDFDYIILSSLLHELEEPRDILESLKKICDKNTIVHINVPNAKSLHRLLAVEMGLIDSIYQLSEQQINMQRYQVFDIEALSQLMCNCGFSIIEQGSYYPKIFTGGQMDQIIQNHIVSERVFEGLYGMGKYLTGFGSEIYVNVEVG